MRDLTFEPQDAVIGALQEDPVQDDRGGDRLRGSGVDPGAVVLATRTFCSRVKLHRKGVSSHAILG